MRYNQSGGLKRTKFTNYRSQRPQKTIQYGREKNEGYKAKRTQSRKFSIEVLENNHDDRTERVQDGDPILSSEIASARLINVLISEEAKMRPPNPLETPYPLHVGAIISVRNALHQPADLAPLSGSV